MHNAAICTKMPISNYVSYETAFIMDARNRVSHLCNSKFIWQLNQLWL